MKTEKELEKESKEKRLILQEDIKRIKEGKKEISVEDKYQEIKKKLIDEKKEDEKKLLPEYINEQFYKHSNLRKVFLAIVKTEPSFTHEIADITFLSKQTCYNQLFNLLRTKLIERIFVAEIHNNTTPHHAEILEKFDKFSKYMPENTRRYFKMRTSLWSITEFGKKFIETVYNMEQEFKEKKE